MSLSKKLTLGYKLNILGLLAGVMLLYVSLSGKPWWVLIGGSMEEPTFLAEVSPFKVNIAILGKTVLIPMLPYLNLAATLSLLIASTGIIIGSLSISRDWSKPLISLKGLGIPLIFLATLYFGLQATQTYVGASIPLSGGFNLVYNIPYGDAIITSQTPSRTLIAPEYWIALTAGILSLIAKIIHGIALKEASKSRPNPHGQPTQ